MTSPAVPRALGLVFAFGTAIASVAPSTASTIWGDITRDADAEARQLTYEQALSQGDALVRLAADPQAALSLASRVEQVGQAIAAYKRARLAWPDGAEAAYRHGTTVFVFFVGCPDPFGMTRACRSERAEHAEAVLEAWHDFSRLAPLDPRATAFLFDRALLHTKLLLLGTTTPEAHLRAAADDYQARLDRGVGSSAGLDPSLGNLAETYMMLGELESAIARYREAVAAGGGASASYGLAVALDRDEQGAQAREVARALGPDAFVRFRHSVDVGLDPFYVPQGEKYYYFALVEDALGLDLAALDDYDRFLTSGAYPRFAPRARANRAALAARLAARTTTRPPAKPDSRTPSGREPSTPVEVPWKPVP